MTKWLTTGIVNGLILELVMLILACFGGKYSNSDLAAIIDARVHNLVQLLTNLHPVLVKVIRWPITSPYLPRINCHAICYSRSLPGSVLTRMGPTEKPHAFPLFLDFSVVLLLLCFMYLADFFVPVLYTSPLSLIDYEITIIMEA